MPSAGFKACWFLPYETRVASLPHPASYPERLAEMMIQISGAKSIVDPFVGSGTTAIVAKRLNLPYAVCDISEEYIIYTRKRLLRE